MSYRLTILSPSNLIWPVDFFFTRTFSNLITDRMFVYDIILK